MKYFLWVFCAITITTVYSCVPFVSLSVVHQEYMELGQRLQRNDPKVPIKYMRSMIPHFLEYNKKYAPKSSRTEIMQALPLDNVQFNRVMKFLHDGDIPMAIRIMRSNLEEDYLNLPLHLWVARLLEKTEPASRELVHHRWVIGKIVSSIDSSGDGRTPKTAIVVYTLGEIYGWLEQNEYRILSEQFADEKFDKIVYAVKAKNKAGDEKTLYFLFKTKPQKIPDSYFWQFTSP